LVIDKLKKLCLAPIFQAPVPGTNVSRPGSMPYAMHVRHDPTAPPGWKSGIVLDFLVPVLIGAAILAFVILIFAASSTRAYS
jgi:hypothetical protein